MKGPIVAVLTGLVSAVAAASLVQVPDFAPNPTGAKMFTYTPDNLSPNAPVVLILHYCGGTANAMYTNTAWASAADAHGFIVIYGQTPNASGCWDVSSPATLTHNGNGDSTSLANMVKYVLNTTSTDPTRVFVTGLSSGGMMVNVMAATFPELFAGASVYAGVPAGCFYTGTVAGWNATCANGQEIHTAQEWAAVAKGMDLDYSGSRPSMVIYHGDADTTIHPQNFMEEIKQWSGVLGYSTAGTMVQQGVPLEGWTTTVYGEKLTGVLAHNVTHNIPMQVDNDLKLFGLKCDKKRRGKGTSS